MAEKDVPSLPLNLHHRISRAIETRLGEAPEQNGAQLKVTLKGYWKLRVGDYRVVDKLVGSEVRIFGIRHRKRVYRDVVQRIGRGGS